jgi:hypothetical protein
VADHGCGDVVGGVGSCVDSEEMFGLVWFG